MDEMDYVLDNEDEIDLAEFDLLAYEIFDLAPEPSLAELLESETEPAAETGPITRSIYTHEPVQLTGDELNLVVRIFGPDPANWTEYAVYDAMKEYMRQLTEGYHNAL